MSAFQEIVDSVMGIINSKLNNGTKIEEVYGAISTIGLATEEAYLNNLRVSRESFERNTIKMNQEVSKVEH